MRWTWIAAGCLLVVLLHLAVGRSESTHSAPPKPVPIDTETLVEPLRETPPQLTVDRSSPSILSLLEIGPPEPTPQVHVPTPQPRPEAEAPSNEPVTRRAADEETKREQQRLNRIAYWQLHYALRIAISDCAQQQLARNPRILGPFNVTVNLRPVLGVSSGVNLEVGFETPKMYVPQLERCIRHALNAASISPPASMLQVSYSYTLQLSDNSEDEDDSEDEDTDADSDSDNGIQEAAAAG